MRKLKMESVDMTQKNIEKIGKLFPNVITEMKGENGKLKKGINFETLKQELSGDVIDGEEAYDFTWVGKKEAIVEANTPIRKTLRPCIEESKDWENTGNLYIEGDNLEVLKLLQESYLGAVKMIYIDPPYNTGNDFIYKDKFRMDKDEYEEGIGYRDDEENRLFQNNESNGRFHSDWCSMMFPRLKLAHNLLSEDGVVFISVDDNEVNNLRKICDEIFGEGNFVASIVWQKKTSPDARMDISSAHDYIIIYAKFKGSLYLLNALPYDEERLKNYKNPDNDPRGLWASVDITGQTGRAPKSQFYEITTPSGQKYLPPEGRCWAMAQYTFDNMQKDNRLWFGKSGDNRPRLKKFLEESEGIRPWTWWNNKFAGHNQEGNKELMQLFDNNLIFDNPKPLKLIRKIISLATSRDKQCVVLDFFAGSSTTAQAVMEMNASDDGQRKYISIQLPQEISDSGNDYKSNNNALKLGYKNICEIGKERIRRAGEKIKAENPDKDLDIGFRVLKVDNTNMKDVYYAANQYTQEMLAGFESNIKDDRTDLDLLYSVLLEWGLPLSLSHKIEDIEGVSIHTVDEDSLVACFADAISEKVVHEIAKRKPLRVVFRDSSFVNSPDKINLMEIFKQYFKCTDEEVRKRVKVI